MEKQDKFFTDFGFKKILSEKKASLVKDVFDSVASKYDLMNDLMSLGIHRLWKKELITMLNPKQTKFLLDVGGGTADIGLAFLKNGGEKATVLDINEKMLEYGKEKALNEGYVSSIEFIHANAEKLPLDDDSFPCYSTSFCIRNVTDINQALKEAYRVLQPGGKFYCLEFSKVNQEVLAYIYKKWSFNVIPQLGKHIAKDEDSYKYLVESIEKFPSQEIFAEMIRDAGFRNVGYKNLSSGIVAIHFGSKI